MFTAWFLVERARLVTAPLIPRRKNKLYLFNMGLSSLWGVILAIMIYSKHAVIREDHQCRIGMGAGPVAGVMGINAFLELYVCFVSGHSWTSVRATDATLSQLLHVSVCGAALPRQLGQPQTAPCGDPDVHRSAPVGHVVAH